MTFSVEDTLDPDLVRLGQYVKIVGMRPNGTCRVIAFLSNAANANAICKLLNTSNTMVVL